MHQMRHLGTRQYLERSATIAHASDVSTGATSDTCHCPTHTTLEQHYYNVSTISLDARASVRNTLATLPPLQPLLKQADHQVFHLVHVC